MCLNPDPRNDTIRFLAGQLWKLQTLPLSAAPKPIDESEFETPEAGLEPYVSMFEELQRGN